jgi:hypothetical protein
VVPHRVGALAIRRMEEPAQPLSHRLCPASAPPGP